MLGHLTYLVFELGWALPVVVLQWAAGWRLLWRRRVALALAVAVPSAYLVLTDSFAIAHGIWTLHDSRILGVRLGNVPVEEAIFFLLTNTLIAQSIILVTTARRLRWPLS